MPGASAAWSAAQMDVILKLSPSSEPESATLESLCYTQNYYEHVSQTYSPGPGTEL